MRRTCPRSPPFSAPAPLRNRLSYLPPALATVRRTQASHSDDCGQLARVRRDSVTVHDLVNDEPNTCRLGCRTPPSSQAECSNSAVLSIRTFLCASSSDSLCGWLQSSRLASDATLEDVITRLRAIRNELDRLLLELVGIAGPTPTSLKPSADDYLTVEEVQRRLHLGRSAAYAFAREHGVRVGRLLRVPKSALPKARR